MYTCLNETSRTKHSSKSAVVSPFENLPRSSAEVSGTPMWALVAENIAYDYMAGCSLGGVRTMEEGGREGGRRCFILGIWIG